MISLKKYLNRFNNKHIINLVGNGGMSLLNMGITALLYRYMTLKDIGIWVFFQSTFGLVDTLRAGLLTTAFIKYYAGASEERAREVVGSAWFLAGIITLFFLFINIITLILNKNFNNDSLSIFLKWFGFVFIITLPSFIANCLLQAEQRFDKLLIIRFTSQIISLLLFLLLIISNNISLNTVLYAGFIAGATVSAIAVAAGWTNIGSIGCRTKSCINQLFHFGKYSIGSAFGSSLFRNSDTIIINFVLGPEPLAAYNLGLRLLELVEMPLRSISATILPILSSAFNSGDKRKVILTMKRYTGMLSVLLLPLCLLSVIFAEQLVAVVNKKYLATDAANAFRILMILSMLAPLDRFIGITLDAIGMPKANFIKLWTMLAINIIADIIFISLFKSINSIAIASFFPTLGSTILGYRYLSKYQPFTLFDLYNYGFSEIRLLSSTYIPLKRV